MNTINLYNVLIGVPICTAGFYRDGNELPEPCTIVSELLPQRGTAFIIDTSIN